MRFKILLLIVVSVSLVFSNPSPGEGLSPPSHPGLRDGLIGSFCFINADCLLAYTTCQSNFCDCQDGFTAIVGEDERSSCHVDTNLVCPSQTIRCTDPNAECTSEPFQTPSGWWTTQSVCRCKPGFIYNPTFNQCQVLVGEQCLDETPCVSGNCNQVTGFCACPGFLVPSTDKVTCGIAIGANCAVAACADANSACSSNVCACTNGFQPSQKSGETFQTCRKRFGASCEEAPECTDEHMTCGPYSKGPATEETRACLCQPGYVPNEGRTICLSSQGVMGGACSVNNQCTSIFGRHAACAGSVCACAVGYSYDWHTTTCIRA